MIEKNDIIEKINKLNPDDLERVKSLIKSFNKSDSQQNQQVPIFLFLIIAMTIGFFTKNMENFTIKLYIGIAILLITTIYTVNNISFSPNDSNMKKILMGIILFIILIHLSPVIRHERYNNDNPQWNTLNSILFEDQKNHITSKFLLLTLIIIPTILIYLEFFKNGDGKKNMLTRGIILAWLAMFVVYIFNVPEGKQLTSEQRETMYQQFIFKYTAFIVIFLLLLNSSNDNSSTPNKYNLAIALMTVIIANVASRILNRSTDGEDGSVLTPSRIPESIQIFITIAILILVTVFIYSFPINNYKLLRYLAPIFLLLVNLLIICFAYIPDLVPPIVLTTIIGIIIFMLTFIIGSRTIDNNYMLLLLSVIVSGVSCYYIYTKMIKDSLNIMVDGSWRSVNEYTESQNVYGTDAGPGQQVDALWDIRINDITDLLVHISAQIIVLYLIARCLSVRRHVSRTNSIIIIIAVRLFVGVSVLPILSPIVYAFTGLGTVTLLADPQNRANLLQSLRNIGQKNIESSDVDNFLLREIKEKLKIMNHIQAEDLLSNLDMPKKGGGRKNNKYRK